MKKRKLIQVGDKVQIVYVDGSTVTATVTHTPRGNSDVWEFEREDNSQLFALNPYSLNFVRWELIERGSGS